MIHTSSQCMMGMALLDDRPVKQPTTISHHSYRNFHIKENYPGWNQKEMSKTISRRYSKMLRRSWSQVESTIPAQEPVLFLSSFSRINATLPILETQGLSSIELPIKKNLLLNFLMITNPSGLTKGKESRDKEGKYTGWPMRDSR